MPIGRGLDSYHTVVVSDPRQDQNMCPSPSEFPEGFREENLRARATFRIFLRPFSSPEDGHPPKSAPPTWARQPLQQLSSNPAYICGVCYVTRSFHIFNMVHDPYFNASSYKNKQISLSQSKAQFRSLREIATCRSCYYWILHDSHHQQ